MDTDSYPGTLLVGAWDFGWGGAGKLRLILEACPMVKWIGADSSMAQALIDPQGSHTWLGSEVLESPTLLEQYDVSAALIVGHIPLAKAMIDYGLPVIFVDSLPYLWTANDSIPYGASAYLAQMCLVMPVDSSVLYQNMPQLRWVEAIVPRAPRPTKRRKGVLVNVGGLHNLFDSAGTAGKYVRATIPPILAGLKRSGWDITGVCGNFESEEVGPLSSECPVGAVDPRNFERLLSASELLISSPGSTTLLQAQAAGIPTLLLPPQNVSQVLNAEALSSERERNLEWPSHIFNRRHFEDLRPRGELAALEYMQGVVAQASEDVDFYAHAYTWAAALTKQGLPAPEQALEFLGRHGCEQVARVVKQHLLAPGISLAQDGR